MNDEQYKITNVELAGDYIFRAGDEPKPTEMVRHPLTGELRAKPKQSKRQARLEALYGKPRTIIVPRGRTGRGLTAEEIRAGLDASAAQGEPTYLKWNLE